MDNTGSCHACLPSVSASPWWPIMPNVTNVHGQTHISWRTRHRIRVRKEWDGSKLNCVLITIRSAEEQFKATALCTGTLPKTWSWSCPVLHTYPPPPANCRVQPAGKAHAPEQTCLFAYPLPKNRGVTNTAWRVWPQTFSSFSLYLLIIYVFFFKATPKSFFKTLLMLPSQRQESSRLRAKTLRACAVWSHFVWSSMCFFFLWRE